MAIPNIKPLSESLSNPIIKSYKAGGLGLVFVFLGTLLLLLALYIGKGILCYLVAALGSLMILSVLYLFYFQDIKKLKDLNASIKNNRELIDTVQAAAIQMTDLAYDLQALAFKNADEIANTITTIRQNLKGLKHVPLLSKTPGFDKVSGLADNKYVLRAEDLSKSIVNFTTTAKEVIENVKTSLVESDPNPLKGYLKQISDLEGKTRELLHQ